MPSPVWSLPICLDSFIPGSYAILLFTALDLASITSHIHSWALFSLWLHLFILSGIISPLFSGSILGTHWSVEFTFQWTFISFCLFILFMGFSRQEYWSGFPVPSPVDHILSELSTMTRPSWVTLHSMAHGFIELDKAISPARSPKLQLTAEQPSTGKCWIPPKKDTPHPREKEKSQQNGRRDEIEFRIKPHTCQRCLESSNKPCVHQEPETP